MSDVILDINICQYGNNAEHSLVNKSLRGTRGIRMMDKEPALMMDEDKMNDESNKPQRVGRRMKKKSEILDTSEEGIHLKLINVCL